MTMIFSILGGLGVFLFGMRIMSTGLQKAAGSKLRGLLASFTKNRFTGIVSGFVLTCGVQSSSATTVMIVSFANAGLLDLAQANNGYVITLEDNYGASIGSAVADVMTASGDAFTLKQMHVRRFPKSARSPDDLLRHTGLSTEDVVRASLEMLEVGVA